MKTLLRSASLLALASLALAAPAQNLVQNPSFELPNSGEYTAAGVFIGVSLTVTRNGSTFASDGGRFSLFGLFPTGSISQTLTTVAGQAYRVGFDLSPISDLDGNATPVSSFTATFGGQTLLSLVNPAPTGYVRQSFLVTSATGGDALAFSATQGSSAAFALDNLSVTPVPEPATMAALGLGAVAMLRRRKRA